MTNLEVSEREQEGIAILDLNGRITAGHEVGAFRAAFEKAAGAAGAEADSESEGRGLHRQYGSGRDGDVLDSAEARQAGWRSWCI